MVSLSAEPLAHAARSPPFSSHLSAWLPKPGHPQEDPNGQSPWERLPRDQGCPQWSYGEAGGTHDYTEEAPGILKFHIMIGIKTLKLGGNLSNIGES